MLSQRQLDASLRNQSGSARRVYSCVPADDYYNVADVMRAMTIAGQGGVPDRKVVSGSLNDLTDAGLIRRTGQDLYRRTAVRASAAPKETPVVEKPVVEVVVVVDEPTEASAIQPVQPTQEIQPMTLAALKQVPALTPVDALSLLAEAAATLRTNAQQMLALADHVEDLSLQLEEERESVKKKMREIDQLKTLLASITS